MQDAMIMRTNEGMSKYMDKVEVLTLKWPPARGIR